MKKFFLWIITLLGGFLLLVAILLALLAFVRIPIDLSGQKALFEWAAEEALDRKVLISGKIVVTTSLEPSFTINQVHIRNRENFQDGDFIAIRQVHIQIALLPLLQGKISLRELTAQGLTVALLENELGKNNWATESPEKNAASPAETARLVNTTGLASDTLVIDRFDFKDIAISFDSPEIEKPFVFTIKKCNGSVQPGTPTFLNLNGAWQAHPFTSRIEVGSLEELLEQDRSWVHIRTKIAATEFIFEGAVDLVTVLDSFNLKATIRGERLDSLNDLFLVNLPPLESYEAVADMSLREKLLNLNKLQINVGDSSLEGNMIVDAQGERPDVRISLTAPQIQVLDFDFKDEDIDTSKPLAEKKPLPEHNAPENDGGLLELLSQQMYTRFDVTSTIQMDKVLSGDDLLGGGVLKANLQKGRFSVDPLQLDLPGGSLLFRISLQPGQDTSAASLTIKVENFDFGIIARRANPETDMGGALNLDVDLRSSGGSIEEILANGNGYIDFSARPENLNSGIMDLWVVNLLAAIIIRSDKDGAPINCMISRWSMSDGMLTPDAFAVDTGIMRICGSGRIDLKKNTLDIKIVPTPKREQFFSLATPFSIKGNIPDIKMGVAAGGLLGTSIRFAVSPVTTPLSWLLAQKIPADGSDICSLPIGAGNRPEKKLPGCR